VHDLFDVLGLPSNAPIGEIRRVCAQRVRRTHPDFRRASAAAVALDEARSSAEVLRQDAAVDFVDMGSLVDRIELSFFHDPS